MYCTTLFPRILPAFSIFFSTQGDIYDWYQLPLLYDKRRIDVALFLYAASNHPSGVGHIISEIIERQVTTISKSLIAKIIN